MKFKSTKALALLLSASMIAGSINMTAFAQEEINEEEVALENVIGEEEITEETATEENKVADESETVADNKTEDNELPGLENYSLDSEQLESLDELENHQNDFKKIEEGKDCVKGELVFLADDLDEALEISYSYGGELISFDYGVGVLRLSDDMPVVQALDEVIDNTDENKVYAPAWPNYYRHATVTLSDSIYKGVDTKSVDSMLNDPLLYSEDGWYQWHHAVIDSESAWELGYTGAGVKVAVLDSGVTEHEDLNIASNMCFAADTDNTDDEVGHGTHVAGIIGAIADNGLGGAGVAPDATIYNYRVLGADGYGEDADIIRAINKAISEKVDVINMSLGGAWYNELFEKVCKKAYDKGVIVVAAAGNEYTSAYSYPAAYDHVISVGAVQPNLAKTGFSNYGSWVDFSAPGSNIVSTYADYETEPGYAPLDGTSMACPVLAGEIAVILSTPEFSGLRRNGTRFEKIVAALNRGAIEAYDDASNVVSLSKALGVTSENDMPQAPAYDVKNDNAIAAETVSLHVVNKPSKSTVYYTVDGSVPEYSNGKAGENTKIYNNEIVIGNQSQVTVNAICVNSKDMVSEMSSITYQFAPVVSSIVIGGPGIVAPGTNLVLTSQVYPNFAAKQKVEYSLAKSVRGVKISNGELIIKDSVSEGTVIKVNAKSSDRNSKATASKTFVVKKDKIFSNIKFTKSKENITFVQDVITYDASKLLNISVINNAKDAQQYLSWSCDNNAVATVDSQGIVTIKGAGVANLSVVTTDGTDLEAVLTLNVTQQITNFEISCSDVIAAGKDIRVNVITNDNAKKSKAEWKITDEEGNETSDLSISSGVLKAKSNATPGVYTLIAKTTDGSELTATKQITVIEDAIKSISLSERYVTIFKRGNQNIAYVECALLTEEGWIGNPSYVELKNSNPEIANVYWDEDESVIIVRATGKSTGTTTITCKSMDGSEKSAKCTVTVQNSGSRLSISMPGHREVYLAAGETLQLTATIENGYGTVTNKEVEWNSSSNDFKVSSNGLVTAPSYLDGDDYTTITAVAKDGSGLIDMIDIYLSAPAEEMEILEYIELDNYMYELNPTDSITMGRYSDAYTYIQVNGDIYWRDAMLSPYFDIAVSNQDVIDAEFLWEVDNGDGTVEDNFVICVYSKGKKGTSTITVTPTDGSQASAVFTVTVK